MTMSSVFMVFALIAVSLCHSGDCLYNCPQPLPGNQMLRENNCLPGYYEIRRCLNSQKILCEKCGKETFTQLENNLQTCLVCYVCGFDEITKSECTNEKNRVCVCKEGLYRIYDMATKTCETCSRCTNCSMCPECKNICEKKTCEHGQFLDKMGKCHSCANHNCLDKSCKSFCDKVLDTSTAWIIILGITLPILLLLGSFSLFCLLCKGCKRRQSYHLARIKIVNERPVSDNEAQPSMPDLSDQQNIHLPLNAIPGTAVKDLWTEEQKKYPDLEQTAQITAPVIINGVVKELTDHDPEKEMWTASVLYTIIRNVPVRRWKEFLRLLSLSDDQMERIELEGRGSYLELQYQMLRLWTQMNGACLENIYSTLHYMDLSGCAEDLQEKMMQFQESLV